MSVKTNDSRETRQMQIPFNIVSFHFFFLLFFLPSSLEFIIFLFLNASPIKNVIAAFSNAMTTHWPGCTLAPFQVEKTYYFNLSTDRGSFAYMKKH